MAGSFPVPRIRRIGRGASPLAVGGGRCGCYHRGTDTAIRETAMTADPTEDRKARAAAWFRELRDRIVAAFEALEDAQVTGPHAGNPPGRFEVSLTRRASDDGSDAGGGLMSVLRGGRVFEKIGVNVSTVHGRLAPRAQAAMAARGVPGMADDPRFWASGISLVAHMQNPHVPAVHMNTRMFWTPHAGWFGGGADLNPCIEYAEDTAHFHAAMQEACDAHHPEYYPRFRKWADEYFFVPHRGRARGVGGIFFDDHATGDWEADFAFTRAVGAAFLPGFGPLVERRRDTPWSEGDRATQLRHRGLYAEYNLVYDRGTKFGLETGHDANAVLMSLPPVATWP
jgi:coproporphyrinogen III oxidase